MSDYSTDLAEANSAGYASGYDDGYADGAAMVQQQLDELRDNMRLVLWHHAQELRDRDWRQAPRKLMAMRARTIADMRRLVDY
jgi:hypothetical protein